MSILEAGSPTARTLLSVPITTEADVHFQPLINMPNHAEIDRTYRLIWAVYSKQRAYLVCKPDDYLRDLRHEAVRLATHQEPSMQLAAQINRAACESVLEERGVAL